MIHTSSNLSLQQKQSAHGSVWTEASILNTEDQSSAAPRDPSPTRADTTSSLKTTGN